MNYLQSAKRQFNLYKHLGDKSIAQLNEDGLYWQPDETSNSIAVIVKHMHGNMLSRWTDFMTTDGEKEWRDRDGEFIITERNIDQLKQQWEDGWKCLFDALDTLTDADLDHMIYIRNDGLTVLDAISRQISHYCYHVGQIVYIAKMLSGDNWQNLSIPRNASGAYNAGKFSQEKEQRDFTKDLLK